MKKLSFKTILKLKPGTPTLGNKYKIECALTKKWKWKLLKVKLFIIKKRKFVLYFMRRKIIFAVSVKIMI
jgi:hypothetical protein